MEVMTPATTSKQTPTMNATHDIDDKPRNERGIIKAEYFVDDEAFQLSTTELPGVGPKTAEKLAEEFDVETIADVIIAQLDNQKDVLSEIAEYEGLRETLREYEDYSRYEAYPVTADTYDGPHEIDEFAFFDGNAPVYVTEGDRVCFQINDRDEMNGELESVELSSNNTVWLHIRVDETDDIYQIKYERGEWVWVATVSDSETDEIEVEFLDDGEERQDYAASAEPATDDEENDGESDDEEAPDYTGNDEIDAIIHEVTGRLREPLQKRVREETLWLESSIGPCTYPEDPGVLLPEDLADRPRATEIVAHEVGHVIHGLAGYTDESGYPEEMGNGPYDWQDVERDDVAAHKLDRTEDVGSAPASIVFGVVACNERYVAAQGAIAAGHEPTDAIPRPYAAVSAAELFAEFVRHALLGDADVDIPEEIHDFAADEAEQAGDLR